MSDVQWKKQGFVWKEIKIVKIMVGADNKDHQYKVSETWTKVDSLSIWSHIGSDKKWPSRGLEQHPDIVFFRKCRLCGYAPETRRLRCLTYINHWLITKITICPARRSRHYREKATDFPRLFRILSILMLILISVTKTVPTIKFSHPDHQYFGRNSHSVRNIWRLWSISPLTVESQDCFEVTGDLESMFSRLARVD
jgi:hypothetical protein